MERTAHWQGPQRKEAAQIAFRRGSLLEALRPRETDSQWRQAANHLPCQPGWPRAVRATRCRGAQWCGCARNRISGQISAECSNFLQMPGLQSFLDPLLSCPSAACADAWDYCTSTVEAATYSRNGT